MKDKPIGVFDSGIGGLTVVRALMERLPDEDLVYFGDSARVPYGTKRPETVRRFCRENLEFLKSKDVKLIVFACNTASALALPVLKTEEALPMTGVILPGARSAAAATRNKKVAVIGTTATIRSKAYEEAIRDLNSDIEILSTPCPLFVSLAEEGWTDNEVARLSAERYLKPVIEFGADTLVLGCTHYPLLKGVISSVMGPDVRLVDSATEVALEVERTLARTGMRRDASAGGGIKVYMSDLPYRFRETGERFLSRSIGDIEKVQMQKKERNLWSEVTEEREEIRSVKSNSEESS
ncbi:MAG: glutamate racemase [Candidatus Latescibacteria bacterium]|nr:glutamate racemase [bacterium]MBD3424354.1 glutamate racemase [Candidatus Latescibacterota bacterium]